MRVQPGGIRSVLPADVACTPALGRTVASSTRQGLGRGGQEPRGNNRSGAPQRPPRPAACTPGPAAASRKARTRNSRENRGYASRPRRRSEPPGPPPSRPSPAHPGSSGCSGSPWRGSRCRSRRRRGCPGVARRTRLPRASADTAQSARPRARREARPGRGVRLPEGRPGAGASPSREPGCGRPAGMTSEPTRRCVTARAGSVRSPDVAGASWRDRRRPAASPSFPGARAMIGGIRPHVSHDREWLLLPGGGSEIWIHILSVSSNRQIATALPLMSPTLTSI